MLKRETGNHAPGRQFVDKDEWEQEPPRRGRRLFFGLVVLATIAAVVAMVLSPLLWPQRPSLHVSPTTLTFTDGTGTGVMPQAVAIQNQGRGRLDWEVSSDAPWLLLEPSTGSIEQDLQVVTVTPDILALSEGTHFATCMIVASGAHNSPQLVSVQVHLTALPEARAIRDLLGDHVEVYYGVQPPYVSGPLGVPIELVRNENAVDVTWDELVVFLQEDPTDESPYIEDLRMCGVFAEQLHNNAEAAGIRAAWVSIDIRGSNVGHALNAFFTSDKGLVFVDCTGEDPSAVASPEIDVAGCDHDKVAYIKPGSEYGLISLDRAASPAYEFYITYSHAWDDFLANLEEYNRLAAEYNELVSGRSLIAGSAEARRAQHLYRELEEWRVTIEMQQEILGPCRWKPLGIVERVRIYW